MPNRITTESGQPKPALGVKIVAGVIAGILALLALAIWAIAKLVAR